MDVYSAYKPLRNHIRRLNIRKSLYAIWSYGNCLQSLSDLPNDVIPPQDFALADYTNRRMLIPEWDLEVLARELISEGTLVIDSKDLCNASEMGRAVNKLKDFDNELAKIYTTGTDRGVFMREFFRVKHRQFPWQIRPLNPIFLTRYYKIFSHPDIAQSVREVVGLDVKTFFRIGIFFSALGLNHFAIKLDDTCFEKLKFSKEELEIFTSHYSIELQELRRILQTDNGIDEKFLYKFHHLRNYPIIKDSCDLICPFPTLLYWRFATGLYYDLVQSKLWDPKTLGPSFEDYVGNVIHSRLATRMTILPEVQYGGKKNRKDTVDWRIRGANATLFIECKTRRIGLKAKEDLLDDKVLETVVLNVVEMLVQLYKTVNEYLNGHYPGDNPSQDIELYPLLVTLENWMVTSSHLFEQIVIKLKEELVKLEIPEKYLELYPFTITDIFGFEVLTEVLLEQNISAVMKDKTGNTSQGNDLATHLQKTWGRNTEELTLLFEDDWNEISRVTIE